MASGFLILPDGRCFARRWSAHDEVLRAVAGELGEESVAQQLKQWLLEQLPGACDEEEIGYGAWLRTADQETVARRLDLREMTVENQHLFCEAAKRAALGERPEEWLRVCLSDLSEMIVRGERGEEPLSNSDWCEVVPSNGARIGPGWSSTLVEIRFSIYLATKTMRANLTKVIPFPYVPRMGEFVTFDNAEMGDDFPFEVMEVINRDGGYIEVQTDLLYNLDQRMYSFEYEQEFDDCLRSFLAEGWECSRGVEPNNQIRRR